MRLSSHTSPFFSAFGLLSAVSLVALGVYGQAVSAQSPFNHVMSPQGYSTKANMTPNASALQPGSIGFGFDRQLPGGPDPSGYNFNLGFGLLPGLEMVGRLATNDLDCNMFAAGACPANMIRDFSGSVKWQLPLERWWSGLPQLAIGATDLGGAATYFRSFYAVASQSFGPDLEVSLGMASRRVPTAPLDGLFGAISWQATDFLDVSAEAIQGDAWLSLRLQTPRPLTGLALRPYLSATTRLSDSPLTDRSWLGLGVSIPLGTGSPSSGASRAIGSRVSGSGSEMLSRVGVLPVTPIAAANLEASLEEAGFWSPRVRTGDGVHGLLLVQVENTAYAWNLLDATAAALGPIAQAYGTTQRPFVLEVTRRGMVLARLQGTTNCARDYLAEGRICSSGQPLAFVPVSPLADASGVTAQAQALGATPFLSWARIRPEIILSPGLITGIGTEAGALDHDLAVNVNLVLPLWKGAWLDVNRVEPTGLQSDDFKSGGAFYNSRFVGATDRKLLHQMVRIPAGDTLVRASYGHIFGRPVARGEGRSIFGTPAPINLPAADWKGWHFEASSQWLDGQVRLSYALGDFTNEKAAANVTGSGRDRQPAIASVRLAPSIWPDSHTELQAGTFWSGDKGYLLTQRFWHGDTAFGVYFRRSRMMSADPYTSFAGFQIAVPLTPRVNRGMRYAGLQGTSQFQYSVETKVLERDNRITQGFGIVPRVGESNAVFANRDRTGVGYLNAQMPRLRGAYADFRY
jgi:hypothetical protein